jgi:hypothetical protein
MEFRLAAMVVQSRFPRESKCLMQASEQYFAAHPDEKLWLVRWKLKRPGFVGWMSRRRNPTFHTPRCEASQIKTNGIVDFFLDESGKRFSLSSSIV